MNSQTDQQLLRDYTGRRSEAAFAELVRRHVDFVYSAALRMVHDAHLAEDVSQGVFVALSQNARQLTDHPVLSGWLHRTTQNLATKAVRTDVRRRAREQEAATMNELLSTEPDVTWEHIAPHLDEALGELNEGDRDALMLRYFERKSAREMAQTLGTSEDAAQKRVSRAVERLREFFAKRGLTVGASGLVVVITANAVQAAPVGLAATIATAAALAGATIATTATATATKAIIMTTLQNTFITVALTAAVGVGIYEARQASTLRTQVQTLEQQQAPLAEQPANLYLLLENTAIVSNAVFEKELFVPDVPPAARKQTFSFKFEGNNYVLSVDGIDGGRFGDIYWQRQGGSLTIYDPQWNKPEGGSGGLVQTERVTRMTVDIVLNWGITEMIPGSAVREKGDNHFSATTADGKKIFLDIQEENSLPVIAAIRTGDTGKILVNVRYKYAPHFCEGKLPIEFTRYWGDSGNEKMKIFTVRMRALELSKRHLPKESLDPFQVATASTAKYFYSNNLAYRIGKNGKVNRVLTLEENNQDLERLRANQPTK